MGRGSAPKAPKFTSSQIMYGNTVIGKTYRDKQGNIINQYIPDPVEEQRKQLVQDKINSLTSSLGRTAPELAAQYTDTENSFIQDATKKFMEQYNPTVSALREDIASRFGTLNTSSFLDSLNDLEKNKASALADIINRGKNLKYDLVNQDETRKLNEIRSLGGQLNSDQSNLLNNLQSSVNASNYLNDFLNSQWMAQLNDYRQNVNSKRASQTALLNTLLNKLM